MICKVLRYVDDALIFVIQIAQHKLALYNISQIYLHILLSYHRHWQRQVTVEMIHKLTRHGFKNRMHGANNVQPQACHFEVHNSGDKGNFIALILNQKTRFSFKKKSTLLPLNINSIASLEIIIKVLWHVKKQMMGKGTKWLSKCTVKTKMHYVPDQAQNSSFLL